MELDGSVVRITSPDEPKYDADFAAVRQFRASVCVLGPLVGRCKQARVALPGGDAIGSRPLDMHQAGLRQLGADCNIEHGCVVASADVLRGAEIQLEFPSVGATENILIAAVVAEGVTIIHNAARTTCGRSLHDAQPDGRADRRCWYVDYDDHRCPAVAPDRAPSHWRPDRGARPGESPRR